MVDTNLTRRGFLGGLAAVTTAYHLPPVPSRIAKITEVAGVQVIHGGVGNHIGVWMKCSNTGQVHISCGPFGSVTVDVDKVNEWVFYSKELNVPPPRPEFEELVLRNYGKTEMKGPWWVQQKAPPTNPRS